MGDLGFCHSRIMQFLPHVDTLRYHECWGLVAMSCSPLMAWSWWILMAHWNCTWPREEMRPHFLKRDARDTAIQCHWIHKSHQVVIFLSRRFKGLSRGSRSHIEIQASPNSTGFRYGISRKLEFSSWSFLCFKAKYVLGWVLCLFAWYIRPGGGGGGGVFPVFTLLGNP